MLQVDAHGYAYGGAIIQDMGYYPHGSFFFSDLTHYVRSGDFVLALLRDSKDLDGYAFALGALSHYAADNNGHPMGTNRAVPLLYPKLKKKYGDSITYQEDKLAHVKTEFGFDVLEVAHRISVELAGGPGRTSGILCAFGCPYATKRKPKDLAKVQAELEQLKNVVPPVVTTGADHRALRTLHKMKCLENSAQPHSADTTFPTAVAGLA